MLSLSRIPAAISFLLFYSSKNQQQYFIALGVAFFALVTDFADGYLARRWRVTSEIGYFLDGLSDKIFYVAIVLVAIREGFTCLSVAWLLIGREICLYALRSVDSHRMKNIENLKPLSLAYALFLRLYFGFFVLRSGLLVLGFDIPVALEYGNLFAYAAIATGYISLAKLVREIARVS
ncbi:MAG: CDP-alcohol phosphatidyltransferase family protein [Formivibrio sp.]|nr:CDP-alcohol phosphatidyltransferase family protein [Formivibrio sp.]